VRAFGPVAALFAGFVATRAAYYAAGVRFDDSTLGSYLQYIDPELLREDLWPSVWHLHYQPPLYNLYLGLVLHVDRDGDGHRLFFATYLLAGLALTFAMYALMKRLGVPPWWSVAVALVFVSTPAVVLYENWLYVDYLVAVALVIVALLLHRFAAGAGARYAAAAFWLLAAVVLSRTLFHLVWLVAVVGLIALLAQAHRREVLLAAALPLLLCAAFYGKNLVQHGTFTASTCNGVNLNRVSTNQLSVPMRQRLIAEGELTRFALAGSSAPSPESLHPRHRKGVRLLDQPYKSTGKVNLNATAWEELCASNARDARTVMRHYPRAYASGVANGTLVYLRPSTDYAVLDDGGNVPRVDTLERVTSAVALGQFERTPVMANDLLENLRGVGWFILLAHAAAVAAAAGTLLRARRQHRWSSPEVVVAAFVLLTLTWVTLAGNLFENGENNRFRFVVDPLVVVMLTAWIAARRTRARAVSQDGPSVM
jgi:hypothetical protein